jgi:hypothetical protein
MSHPENLEIANRLQETAPLLEHQGADPFRVRAYRDSARTLATLGDPVSALLARGGLAAREELPGIGPKLRRTHDWVVLYYDGDRGERQCTVITAEWGVLRGRRIVRGREAECEELYRRSGSSSGGAGGTSPGGSGVSGGGAGTMRVGPGTSTG